MVRCQCRVAFDEGDRADVDAELFRGHLADRDAQALPQIDLAAVDRDAAVGMDGEKPVDVVHIERLPERAIGTGDDLRDAGRRQHEADDERAAVLKKFAPRDRSSHAFVSFPFPFARITARRIR